MKTTLLICFGILFWSAASRAENWYVPSLESEQEVWVFNTNNEDDLFWISPPFIDATSESAAFEIPAGGFVKINKDELPKETWSQIRTRRGRILRILIKQGAQWSNVPEGRTSVRGSDNAKAEAIFVNNLSAMPQEASVRVQKTDGEWMIKSVSLKAFEQAKVDFNEPIGSKIEVVGELNLLAHTWYQDHIELLPAKISPTFQTGSRARFLMADPNRTQSFVIELKDPEQIAKAREQIRNPDTFQARILIADLAPGSGNTNQDLANPLKGPWSWHVANPIAFTELASQSCDTSPEQVEEFLNGWFESGLRVCMWNYHVVKELDAPTTVLAP